MELLHEDLLAISDDLSGIKILVGKDEYYFGKFYLDAERVPPVADGYVLQLRLLVAAWRYEKMKRQDGTEAWIKAKYSFKPCEVSFIADKTIINPESVKQ